MEDSEAADEFAQPREIIIFAINNAVYGADSKARHELKAKSDQRMALKQPTRPFCLLA
jgi:hypothetical protein